MKIALVLNGRNTEWEALPGATLLAVLRGEGLTAAKRGCETGDCGACTVLLDGQPVNSCVVAAARAHGRQVTTLEGLAGDPLLKQLQEALVEHAGIQCGYCTPGMLVSLLHLMRESRATGAQPDDHAIREALSGNLCRCTGYVKPVAAAAAVAAALSTIPASGTEAS
ncbi:MAG: (2Fe-2S)-binding protein [bacterium]|nr:(2Fe-2S)-binding protein [bacterium]MBK9472710.1 (2Fe-2S)-binding protein [bacterium]